MNKTWRTKTRQSEIIQRTAVATQSGKPRRFECNVCHGDALDAHVAFLSQRYSGKACAYGSVHRNDGSSGCSRFGLAQRSQCDGRRDDAVDAYPVFCRSGTQDGHEIQKTPMEMMNEALVRNSGRKPMRCECSGRRGEAVGAHPVFCRSGIQ